MTESNSPRDKVDCPHAKRCGGCALIEHSLADQLALKGKRLGSALDGYHELQNIPRSAVIAADPITGYRTRTKLMVDALGWIGLFARDSHTVVDIPDCRVMPTLMHQTVQALRGMVAGTGIEAIDVRETQNGQQRALLVTLIAGATSVSRVQALADQVAQLPNVVSVAVSARDRGAVQLLGRDLRVVHGPDYVIDRVHPDAPFVHASHGSFVQAHRQQAYTLQSHVVSLLQRTLGNVAGARIVELHCGEAALGLRLAQLGASMLLVDAFEPAIVRVREAAAAQQLSVDAWAMDAGDALSRLVDTKQSIDAVILDPPRRGVSSALRQALATLKPKAIAYVSCGPETFARDLSHLAQLGYAAQHITPFDLIPLSEEVESVALLTPTAPPPPRTLYEDAEVTIVDKPAHVALAGEVDASGICVIPKRPEHERAWSKALAEGQQQYRALVRGITRDKGNINRTLREGSRSIEARTRFKRIEVIGGHSLLNVTLEGSTARSPSQQVLRHLASLKHPVLGDARHGDPKSNRHLEHKHGLDRAFLHCTKLALIAPTTGESLTIESSLPGELNAVLTSLRR